LHQGNIFSDSNSELRDAIKEFRQKQVLFWPTYRRVERSIKIDKEENSSESESYAFGMADIEKKILDIEKALSEDALGLTANMNRDLLVDTLTEKRPPDQFFSSIKDRLPEIQIILERTQILKEKDALIEVIKSGKLRNANYLPLAQIIYRLLEGFKALARKDEKIKQFTASVNNYLVDNEFVYDERTVRIFCRNRKSERVIKLEHMSSGEKHIIAFMSYLYLVADTENCIIIDEPELSLSSEWQEKLLVDIMNSGQVGRLVCATHSPFIFNNIYSPNAVPLNSETLAAHDK
jgi:hypothetical protein